MQARRTEEEAEEVKQQERMAVMTRMMRKMWAHGRMDAQHIWWVGDLLVADCKKGGSTQNGNTHCNSGTTGCMKMMMMMKKKGRRASEARGSDDVKC